MKKLLALLLTLCLVIGMVPLAASAEGTIDSADALKSAITNASGSTKIKLDGSFSVSESVTIDSGKDITIDLNGQTLTITKPVVVKGKLTVKDSTATDKPVVSGDGYNISYTAGKIYNSCETRSTDAVAIEVRDGGSFVHDSGTIQSLKNYTVGVYGQIATSSWNTPVESSLIVNGGYQTGPEGGPAAFGNGATVTVNGGVIEGTDNSALAGKGTKDNENNYGGYTINVNDGILIGRIVSPGYVSCAIYHPNDGEVNIKGGLIVSTNGAGIVSRAGETNITGGTIIALGDEATTGKVGDSRVVVSTSGVVLDLSAKYPGAEINEGKAKNASITVSGKAIISGSASAVSVVENDEVAEDENVEISDGTFSDPVKAEYCVDGKAPLVTGNRCTIANVADLKDKPKDENGVYYAPDAAERKFEATVTTADGTMGYKTLEEALEVAKDKDTITLLNDVTISGGAGDTQGILTIDKNITIDGQNHRITAENNVQTGSSMINIQNGANVTIKNVKIDSENTKHGLNTYTAPDATEKTTVTLENVEIKNGTGYGIVANNTVVNATNLTTSGNGWGGVNVDKGAQVTVGGASNLGEESSIVYENATTDSNGEKGSLTVNGGTYQNIVVQAAESTDVIVGTVSLTGGTFNGVVAKGEGTTNPTTIVDITGGKFTKTAAEDVGGEGDGKYVAIKDLIPEDYEITSDGTVKEEEPYVPPVIPTYKTTVEECEGGSVVASPSSAREGQKVTLTVKPQAGQELKSLKVTDKDGDAVTLTKVEGGYTFNMPKGGVTVTAVFGCDGGSACPSKGFTDVDSEKWYHEYMDYAVEKGLLEGTSPTTMEPGATLTRAQLAQILYNLEGKPAVTGDLPFEDVPEGQWYYAAILWANQEGVVDGMSPDTFAPNEDISRQDLALMLYRYAGEPETQGILEKFQDAGKVGNWAKEAITWAVEGGIIDGMTPTTLEPTGTATRAQAAAMLQRFLEG